MSDTWPYPVRKYLAPVEAPHELVFCPTCKCTYLDKCSSGHKTEPSEILKKPDYRKKK